MAPFLSWLARWGLPLGLDMKVPSTLGEGRISWFLDFWEGIRIHTFFEGGGVRVHIFLRGESGFVGFLRGLRVRIFF